MNLVPIFRRNIRARSGGFPGAIISAFQVELGEQVMGVDRSCVCRKLRQFDFPFRPAQKISLVSFDHSPEVTLGPTLVQRFAAAPSSERLSRLPLNPAPKKRGRRSPTAAPTKRHGCRPTRGRDSERLSRAAVPTLPP